MNKQKLKVITKSKRARRTRALLWGTTIRPRISVHKTNKYVYIQCIDDTAQKTILGASTAQADMRTVKGKEKLQKLIQKVVQQMKEKEISTAIFDRGSYRYHGVVRYIAQELRNGGIKI
jgi:large subunit ribosomal protein L18